MKRQYKTIKLSLATSCVALLMAGFSSCGKKDANNDTQLASLKENEFINSIENANVDPTNLPSKEDYSQYLIDN